MSYKISLIRIDPTLATADAMQRALADMERLSGIVSSRSFSTLSPADRARFHDITRHREAAATAVMRADASLQRVEIDYAATAQSLGIPEEDVRIFEPVLLRADDFHVEMSGDSATIVVDKGTRDRERMKRVWKCIESLTKHGYSAFDPQLEESVVPSFGFDRYFERWAV